MPELHLTLVVPFHDEEDHLPATLAAVAAQRRLPDELVLVDDGSTDGSPALAAAFAAAHPWAHVAVRPPRDPGRDRLAGGAAARAFAWGVEQVRGPWDVVAKLDADLVLGPLALEAIAEAFTSDPSLGMAGPYISAQDEHGRLVRQACRPEHVEGEACFYRRACFEDLVPFPAMLGWDTIDEVRARLAGWRTASLEIPGGDPVHARAMGDHDGRLRAWRRWGACAYGYGEHPLHVAAVAVQRLGQRPRGVGSALYVAGWAEAALRRRPRAEAAVRAEVRRDQLHRLGARARRGGLALASGGRAA